MEEFEDIWKEKAKEEAVIVQEEGKGYGLPSPEDVVLLLLTSGIDI